MTPDSVCVDRLMPSPNHGERRNGAVPSMLVLHYTGMQSGEAAIQRLTDEASEVSAHYLVEEDGSVIQLVPEARRAWHAGRSAWRDCTDLNSTSIGIEIVNPGHEWGYRPFPADQITAVIELCRDCVTRWDIRPEDVVAHSDIAPDRKEDPGELFPWDQLFAAGVGQWVLPAPEQSGRFLARGDRGAPVAAYQALLKEFGYPLELTADFDAATFYATRAFQRHFRPVRIDGVADFSTITTLHRLLTNR